MSTQSFDSVQYKAGQRREWDTVAEGWHKWWKTFEQGAQHVSDRLVALAAIDPGHQVLDIATGIGEPALTAARRVGANGRVMATDQSSGMLDIARERADDLGLDHVDFKLVDAESLAFDGNTFDAAVCRWGLMFMPDLGPTLKDIRQLLKPGGRFAAAVWSTPDKVPALRIPMGVIRELLQPPPPPPEAPSLFKLSPPGVIEEAFTEAGFTDVNSEKLMVDFGFSTVEDYITFLQDVAAVITILMANEPAERQREIWQAIAEAVGGFVTDDGAFQMSNETILVVGRRPA